MIELKENVTIEPQTLGDALEFLTRLVKDKKNPNEAVREFEIFRERHKPLSMDIVWEEERYSDTANYDVLFHLTGQGSVSLSFCPDRTVPWVLRHAHNPEANVVVRVNSAILTVEMVMAYLDFIWDEAPVITDLVNKCLMQEAIQKQGIEVSDEELQEAMNAFRKKHGLYSAEETHEWLKRRGTTQEHIEDVLWSEVAVNKLKNQIAGEHVEEYFERHRVDFDTAQISRFKVADEETARNIYNMVRKGEINFFDAAQDYFFSNTNKDDGKMFAVVRRGNLSANHAATIFAAASGELIEPIKSGNGYDIVRVLRLDAARLDDQTREIIKEILFKRWLDERRAESTIEWFWGRKVVVKDETL